MHHLLPLSARLAIFEHCINTKVHRIYRSLEGLANLCQCTVFYIHVTLTLNEGG